MPLKSSLPYTFIFKNRKELATLKTKFRQLLRQMLKLQKNPPKLTASNNMQGIRAMKLVSILLPAQFHLC